MKDRNKNADQDSIADAWDRIAEAVDLFVLEKINHGDDLTYRAVTNLRERIAARYQALAPSPDVQRDQAPSLASPPTDDDPEWRDVPAELMRSHSIFRGDRYWSDVDRAWRIAPSTFSVPVIGALHWIKRHDHAAHKLAPQTADVLGSELRSGDCVVGKHFIDKFDLWVAPVLLRDVGSWIAPTATYRVRLPRPPSEPVGERCTYELLGLHCHLAPGHSGVHACTVEEAIAQRPQPTPEPSAKVKCPACRCMIVPGSPCTCCASMSGDYPPLPDLDLDESIDERGERDVKPVSPGPRDQCARMLGPGKWCSRAPGHDGACEAPDPGTSDEDICGSLHPTQPRVTCQLQSGHTGDHGAPSDDLSTVTSWQDQIVSADGQSLRVGIALFRCGMPEMAARAINVAHVRATRELRTRCERAERIRDTLASQADRDVATIRDLGCKLADRSEVRALIERARSAEAERDEARRELSGTEDACDREREKRKSSEIERDTHKRRAELAERRAELLEAAMTEAMEMSGKVHEHSTIDRLNAVAAILAVARANAARKEDAT